MKRNLAKLRFGLFALCQLLAAGVAVQAQNPPAARPQANLDSLYNVAVAAVDRQDWLPAMINFEKIHLLQPSYRDVIDRLATARANAMLAATPPKKVIAAGKSPAFYVGSVATLIVLPLLGFVVLSPVSRARFYLMRGNFAAATQIYENVLARHPHKVKLYPVLANIYFQQGRRDENAMKIYRTVLQLNLAAANREEINLMVAQKYLTEGRTDSDAIEVLEGALQAEQRRSQN